MKEFCSFMRFTTSRSTRLSFRPRVLVLTSLHRLYRTVWNGVSPGLYPSLFGLCGKHELASIPPTTPYSASSLPKPTRPPDIRNSVYSALWLLQRGGAGPIRSISARFEKRITNISPLQPQTRHVQRHQWMSLMCQDEYVRKCVFINECVFLVGHV